MVQNVSLVEGGGTVVIEQETPCETWVDVATEHERTNQYDAESFVEK